MASKKLILLAVIVVAVIAVAAIGLSGDKEPDARYNYDLEVMDSFKDPYGDTVTPYNDGVFAVLTVTIANDHYASGITTNDMINRWVLSTDTVSNDSASLYTSDYPGDRGLVDIVEGATLTYPLVYIMPAETTVDDISVSHKWVDFTDGPSFVLDESL